MVRLLRVVLSAPVIKKPFDSILVAISPEPEMLTYSRMTKPLEPESVYIPGPIRIRYGFVALGWFAPLVGMEASAVTGLVKSPPE